MLFLLTLGLVSTTHEELEAEWSAHSAQSLASFKGHLPRVHHSHPHGGHGPHLELRPTRSNAASGWPRVPPGYNGVSAVGHLMAEDFQRGKKQPLRATIASRSSGARAPLPAAILDRDLTRQGPSSLPSQFVPRAPIPTPEVLAAKKLSSAAIKSSAVQKKSKSAVKKSAVERGEVSADIISAEPKPQQLYQSPRDRDGDYSYAYDCSISPAVVIKWGEDEEEEDEPIKGKQSALSAE